MPVGERGERARWWSGKVLRRWRKEKNLSLDEVDDAAGVAQRTIRAWETHAIKRPSKESVAAVIAVYGKTLEELAAEVALEDASAPKSPSRATPANEPPLDDSLGEVRPPKTAADVARLARLFPTVSNVEPLVESALALPPRPPVRVNGRTYDVVEPLGYQKVVTRWERFPGHELAIPGNVVKQRFAALEEASILGLRRGDAARFLVAREIRPKKVLGITVFADGHVANVLQDFMGDPREVVVIGRVVVVVRRGDAVFVQGLEAGKEIERTDPASRGFEGFGWFVASHSVPWTFYATAISTK